MGNNVPRVHNKSAAPEWFGAAARGISFFPVMMSVYMLIYSIWWPFAWGATGLIAFAAVLAAATVFTIRGIRQI